MKPIPTHIADLHNERRRRMSANCRRARYAQHARRFGMTTEEYQARRGRGEKRCPRCAQWKNEREFNRHYCQECSPSRVRD